MCGMSARHPRSGKVLLDKIELRPTTGLSQGVRTFADANKTIKSMVTNASHAQTPLRIDVRVFWKEGDPWSFSIEASVAELSDLDISARLLASVEQCQRQLIDQAPLTSAQEQTLNDTSNILTDCQTEDDA